MKNKPNYPVIIGLAVVLVIAAPFLISSGYIPVEYGSLLDDGEEKGPQKGTVVIRLIDTPIVGSLHIECDKTGRDYFTAWKYTYSTPEEASEIATRLGLSGYHQHGEQFMPGQNHQSFISGDDVAIRIPNGNAGEKYVFYESDPDWLTCFYQRDSRWSAGAVKWQLNGVTIDWDSERCIHKSSIAAEVALGAEPHCAVVEIPITGNYELIIIDLDEYHATARIEP